MNFLPLLAVYTLFQVWVRDDTKLTERAAAEVDLVEATPFGVFVTIVRSQNQVHGCIGNWSSDYARVSGLTLVNWMRQVTHSARFSDRRRALFPTDVDEDVTTELEVNVMLLPLQEVNATSGFDNAEQGLIVQGENGKRATYLPRVFDNESWENISQSLRQKAGLSLSDKATFYAYKTYVVKVKVYDVLFSARARYYLQKDVAHFYNKYFETFVPYEFDSRTLVARVDKTEAVRNAGSLANVLQLYQAFQPLLQDKLDTVISNLDYYYVKWYTYEAELSQASIFLLKAYILLRDGGVSVKGSVRGAPDAQKRIAFLEEGLYNMLLSLEPQFAMGEAVSTLAPLVNAATSSDYVEKLLQACEVMRGRLDSFRVGKSKQNNLHLVFEINWQSQSTYEMLKLSLAMYPQHAPFFQSYVVELSEAMLQIVPGLDVRLLETNYLAVIYECLCFQEASLPLAGQQVPHLLQQQKIKFFTALLEERRGRFGLFYFNGTSVARLDLTGHALFSFL